jgi:hypothetical protein
MPIARQRVAEHILTTTNTSIIRQRHRKHAFATIEEAVFSIDLPQEYVVQSTPVWRRGRIPPP